jgi:hypothetical protein
VLDVFNVFENLRAIAFCTRIAIRVKKTNFWRIMAYKPVVSKKVFQICFLKMIVFTPFYDKR